MKNINFIDLFSGVGGFSSGLIEAGYKHILSVDNNKYCKDAYRINFPEHKFILKDISKLFKEELLGSIGKKKIHLVVGGPPCQGFSTIGKRISSNESVRNSKDKRNNLVYEFIRIVEIIQPSVFVMENVRGIKTRENGNIFSNLLKRITRSGYAYKVKVLNAAHYGVPQNRERVFIIGTNTKKNIEFPDETHGLDLFNLKPLKTVGEAFQNLENKKDIKNHIPLKHGHINVKRYKFIPEGGRMPEDKLPKELYRRNFGNTFKRLDRKLPSLTMVPGHNAFPLHPTLNRSLTVREAARIQTFDDRFEFVGPRHEQCIQVGNAVPPLLGKVIGKKIMDIFYAKK